MYNTKNKKMILEYMKSTSGTHITVNDICEDMKKRGSPVGVTTVYRQLERLAGEGLVHRYVSFPGESACYAYIGERGTDVSPCYHFKCERCGRLLHIKCAELTNFKEHISASHGFDVDLSSTVFMGICGECSGKVDEPSCCGEDHPEGENL